jgi:hypothetical protein
MSLETSVATDYRPVFRYGSEVDLICQLMKLTISCNLRHTKIKRKESTTSWVGLRRMLSGRRDSQDALLNGI